jgi:hypothetical protein
MDDWLERGKKCKKPRFCGARVRQCAIGLRRSFPLALICGLMNPMPSDLAAVCGLARAAFETACMTVDCCSDSYYYMTPRIAPSPYNRNFSRS